jgi:ribonuclease R
VYNRRKGKRPEGEVIEVVERHKTDFVGVDIQKTLHLYLQQILKCIQIFYSKDKIGEQGDVVLVHIEDWPKRADSPWSGYKSAW